MQRTRLRGPGSPLKVIVWRPKCCIDKQPCQFSCSLILTLFLRNPVELHPKAVNLVKSHPDSSMCPSVSEEAIRPRYRPLKRTVESSTDAECELQAHTG